MIIADKLKDTLRKTREELGKNFDQKDKEFINLYEELKRLFNKKNLDEITQEEMTQNIDLLEKIYSQITELNRKNNLLKEKDNHDKKYTRLHKRVLEKGNIVARESILCEILMDIKERSDEKVLTNNRMLDNESYFVSFMSPLIIEGFEKRKIKLDPETAKYINGYLVREYINEYNNNTLC